MNPIFARDVFVVQSSDAFDKCVKTFLTKAVSSANQPEQPHPVAQRAAADGYGSAMGPIFSDLVAAGAIVDGGAATPGVAERFNENLAALIGASTGNKNFYGKRSRSKSASEEHEKSLSASYERSRSEDASYLCSSVSQSASARQDGDDELLERFAAGLDREMRKVAFGKGVRVGHHATYRDGTRGIVTKAADGMVEIRTERGELRGLVGDFVAV